MLRRQTIRMGGGRPPDSRGRRPTPANSYVELVVSSSKTLVEKSKAEIVDLALSELREFFPGARAANLVKSTVIKEVHATYSPRPGIEILSPKAGDGLAARLSCRRLDGDWLARHHGRRGAQRLRGRAVRGASRGAPRRCIPGPRPAGFGIHAAVWVNGSRSVSEVS